MSNKKLEFSNGIAYFGLPTNTSNANGQANSTAASSGDSDAAPFIKGVGIHIFQSSGDKTSNWSHILKSWAPLNWLRFSIARLQGGSLVNEKAPDTWNRYQEDVDIAADLGCNGFRLSLEWSRIEPTRGYIDQEAVARFNEILDALTKAGMQPNLTLHHFTHPQWFDEIGAFQHEENIPIFAEYAVKMVQLFGNKVKMWATFNEPTSSAVMGYLFGAYPPGHMFRFVTAGRVLLNMLRAHVAAYKAIKALPGGEQYQVGITHMLLPFEAWPDFGWLTAPSKFVAKWMTHWWGWDAVHQWMLTGKYAWCVPFYGCWIYYEEGGRPPCDWFGVNYYSRPVVSAICGPGRKPWQVLSDLQYPIDPTGMYEMIKRCSKYGIPMYVTETGVSIPSEEHRAYAIDSYMKEILHAIRDGYDVRGLYYWTLLDNWEWNAGYSIKFGLFAWEPNGKVDRVMRSSAKTLKNYYKTLPDTVSAVRKAAQSMSLAYPKTIPPLKSISWLFMSTFLALLDLCQMLIGTTHELTEDTMHRASHMVEEGVGETSSTIEKLQERCPSIS
eukprot:jgi/Chrzof1/9103/Cz03g36040.t1